MITLSAQAELIKYSMPIEVFCTASERGHQRGSPTMRKCEYHVKATEIWS